VRAFEEKRIKTDALDLTATAEVLDKMPQVDRVKASMEMAVFFLEYAAYEMALGQDAEEVSEIILMAAKLDQASQRLDSRSFLRAGEHNLRKM